MKIRLLFVLLVAACHCAMAQVPDSVYVPNIRTAQLFAFGNQLAYPIIRLNTADRVELDFDDLDADVKNYYYSYQLCNADWTPAMVSEFDYIRGFTQTQLMHYQFSSVALNRYTHYQLILPEQGCIPIRSGNFLLKVFLDGDTSKLCFTRRLLVVDNSTNITAQILLPMNPQITRTHQKLQFTINTRALNISNAPLQVKVIILQNNRWDNSIRDIRPSFYSGNTMQFNSDDDYNFPAGKEWRWLDLQSFRFQSDRVKHAQYLKNTTEIFVQPDVDRSRTPYYFYNDYNGLYTIQSSDNINPYWQGDYANVHFSFVPPGNTAFPDKDVYLLGELTNYAYNDSTKLRFNTEKGIYETTIPLKMGIYYYAYVTLDRGASVFAPSFEFTEGNNMETENDYTILVYYRELGGRADQLVGISRLNSLNGKSVQ